jgi:mannitol/fructose-specific phosphotransferase system IIA component (Ntr-type)
MDMDLYRSDLGMVVISAAIFNDLVGWIIFAIILGLMDNTATHPDHILITVVMTLAFAGMMLTVGRWLIHKILPFLQAYTRWPSGVLGFALTLSMFGAAFTEWIGIHAIFGSFLVGVAIGDSSHLRERTRVTIEHFVSSIFAPVFFASIGLNVDFLAHFDPLLILTVMVIACFCKLAGGILGARWGGMHRREAWAVGFALNSRGAMEIILGLLALKAGIIPQKLFVALVVMAIVTSMMSGPVMRLILGHDKRRRLEDALVSRLFFRQLTADCRRGVIHEMAMAACDMAGLSLGIVEDAVWAREESLSTGIGNGVALPHARIHGLANPIVAVGFSDAGIDFDAPDGKPANLIFLILTSIDDSGAQLELASEIARLFRNKLVLDHVLRSRNFTDFLAFIKSVEVEGKTV